MAYDRTALANRALEKLRIVGIGQSPEAEDTEKVDDKIDAVVAFLGSTTPAIYVVADPDDIDEHAFEWLADYLAYMCAPDFAKPRDDTVRQMAEYMLRRLTSGGPTYEVVQAEYF